MTRSKGRREMTDSKDVGFYNPHSGLKGRDGGPYLDQIERQVAEANRAVAEKREVITDEPLPATAGVPLVSAAQVIDNSYTSNPSMAGRPGFEIVLTDDVLGKSDDDNDTPYDVVSLVSPTSVLPVDVGTEAPDLEQNDGDESLSPAAGSDEDVPNVDGPAQSDLDDGDKPLY